MINWLIDILLPRRCVLCDIFILNISGQALCVDCWNKLKFITLPICNKCGSPLAPNLAMDFFIQSKVINENNTKTIETYMICNVCRTQTRKIYYKNIRAVFEYENWAIKHLIKNFKYNDDLKLCKIFVKWLLLLYNQIADKIDIIVPVPLHRRKLMIRRYNQSAVLTALLSKTIDKMMIQDALIRTKNVISQNKKSMQDRWNNVEGIFSINNKFKNKIEDQRILLIDDVVTTSATVNECAKILMIEGAAKSVNVFAIARTVAIY